MDYMETTKEIFSLMRETKLEIPLVELVAFVIINSVAILYKRHKFGLLVSYCFLLYWGFIMNFAYLSGTVGTSPIGMATYIFFGTIMVCLMIASVFMQD
jgi:hypothetical protein